MLRNGPSRLVLLGHPVAHSLSPALHGAALLQAGIAVSYEAVDVDASALAGVVTGLVAENAAGNVTIPYKAAVAELCDRVTPTAELVGAVNTWWTEDGELVGDNTDVGGFHALVRRVLGCAPAKERVAVLGAGGAASAVVAAVSDWDDSRARIFNRDSRRAVRLAARYPDVARAENVIEAALADATIVVNATPVGIDAAAFPVPLDSLPRGAAVIDLVYVRGRRETTWVSAARERGHRAGDGLGMLVEQAALSFHRWFGIDPDRGPMWAAVSG